MMTGNYHKYFDTSFTSECHMGIQNSLVNHQYPLDSQAVHYPRGIRVHPVTGTPFSDPGHHGRPISLVLPASPLSQRRSGLVNRTLSHKLYRVLPIRLQYQVTWLGSTICQTKPFEQSPGKRSTLISATAVWQAKWLKIQQSLQCREHCKGLPKRCQERCNVS